MIDSPNNIPTLPVSDISFLKQLIPHREPIILIETLQYHNEKKILASLTVVQESLFVVNNTFSEAGLLEHMAQCVALHTGFSGYIKNLPTRKGYIGAIKKAEIIQLPKVGETILTEALITYSAMDMTLVTIQSSLGNNIIASAEMSTILAPETI